MPFVKNRFGIVHETTEAIAKELVGRGEVELVEAPKEEKKSKKEE